MKDMSLDTTTTSLMKSSSKNWPSPDKNTPAKIEQQMSSDNVEEEKQDPPPNSPVSRQGTKRVDTSLVFDQEESTG